MTSHADQCLQSALPSARRRAATARAGQLRALRRRGVVAFLAAMTLVAGGAAADTGGSRAAAGAAPRASLGLLERGSRGPLVVRLQRALRIRADGHFGAATERAVRRFQHRHRLTVDGIAGPATLAALGVSTASRPPEAVRGMRAATGTRAILQRIALCESGGNPRAVSPDGRYRGKYQFTRATWRSLGGTGDPARAPETEQDRRAATLLARAGTAPWPSCA